MIETRSKARAFSINCTVGIWSIAILLFHITLTATAYAQYENVWVYGNGCGMDFNQANPDPIIIPTNMESYGEGNASVCDDQGQLLFYTNGYKVWDGNGNIMPNGNGLINDPFFPPLPAPGFDDYTSSTSQGALIVPQPEQPGKYYVFSMTSLETGVSRLYYSIVDMQLNGGMGDVVPTSKGIFMGNDMTEHMAGVVGDRCNTWLLVISRLPNELHAYSITSEGIDPNPVISPLLPVNYYTKFGTIDAAPNRRMLAIGRSGFGLYDFDPATGIATGKVELIGNLPSLTFGYSACFSPNSSKLYVSYVPLLGPTFASYQFDLSTQDSLTIVNSIYELTPAVTRYKRAPNGRIYTTQSMVIKQPDLPGTSCEFEPVNLAGACAPGSTGGFPGLPNVVPVPTYDTLLTSQEQSAPCFASQTAVSALDDSTGWDYLWNTGVTGKEILADTPGTYWVTYHTPPCVYHVDTFRVSFPHGVLPTIYTHAECRSDSNGYAYAATYPGDPVSYSYTWMQSTDTLSLTDTLAPVPSGSYSLHVQTNTGCDTLLFFDLPEEDFRVSFAVSDTLICLGDTIQFTNTSDNHFTGYHWDFANGDTSRSFDPLPYRYPQSGAYRVMLAGEGEVCRDTAYTTILVDQPLEPGFTLTPQEVCLGQPVYLSPHTDSTTVQLRWDFGEPSRTEANLESRYQHAFEEAGVHPIHLSLQSRACPDTSYIDSIRVYPLPEVDLGGDSSICLHGQPVYLKNLRSAPLNPHHYLWSTSDTTAVLKVVHPGTYTLSVTTDPIGCTTTESIQITKDCYIDIPNAFTPNGDGQNDYFFPRQLLSESVNHFRMQVFNRWGQIVFETKNLNGRGWDGRFNDKAQPMGVYLYRIEAEFSNGRQEQYEGNVTLLQ